MTTMVDRPLEALARSGARRYDGEVVPELEHALQCAEDWAPLVRCCVPR